VTERSPLTIDPVSWDVRRRRFDASTLSIGMTNVGIVGAGASAATLTHVVDGATDADVTVLEKSRGLCGRAATRRKGPVTYDYGANYLKDEDERIANLVTETLDPDGLVNIPEPIYTFDADGTISEGRPVTSRKWSYRQGLTQVAKRLFARTDATVHRTTRVTSIRQSEGGESSRWTVTDGENTEHGPFDILVLNPPAPQTAELLKDADWQSDTRAQLLETVEEVPFRTVWSAVLHYPFRLDKPYYALVNPGKNHPIGWVSREECKRGHVPDGESALVVQPSEEWSKAHYDDPNEANEATLAEMTATLFDDERLADPDWTDGQGWMHALPEGEARRGPLRAAEEEGLYCTGDWITGEARLHAAMRNGFDAGERISYSL
jgi:Predicted NAD/FAD-dependent oxidoreductase